MNANCEPPVNINALKAMVCQILSPAATDNAPKEMPYKPVATEMENPMRTAGVIAKSLNKESSNHFNSSGRM